MPEVSDLIDSFMLENMTSQEKTDLLVYLGANDALGVHLADVANPHSVTKTQVGLGNVDDTSDADKPISTSTQVELDLKVSESTRNQPNGFAGLNGDSEIGGIIINRSDTLSGLSSLVLKVGELAYATDTGDYYKGDGATAGGSPLAGAGIVQYFNLGSHDLWNGEYIVNFENVTGVPLATLIADYEMELTFETYHFNESGSSADDGDLDYINMQIFEETSIGSNVQALGEVPIYLGSSENSQARTYSQAYYGTKTMKQGSLAAYTSVSDQDTPRWLEMRVIRGHSTYDWSGVYDQYYDAAAINGGTHQRFGGSSLTELWDSYSNIENQQQVSLDATTAVRLSTRRASDVAQLKFVLNYRQWITQVHVVELRNIKLKLVKVN